MEQLGNRDETIETLNKMIKSLTNEVSLLEDLKKNNQEIINTIKEDNRQLLDENKRLLEDGERIVKKYNNIQRILDVDDKAKRIKSQELKIKALTEINESQNKKIDDSAALIETLQKTNVGLSDLKIEWEERAKKYKENLMQKEVGFDEESYKKQIIALEQYQKIDNEKIADLKKELLEAAKEISELNETIVEIVKGKVLRK